MLFKTGGTSGTLNGEGGSGRGVAAGGGGGSGGESVLRLFGGDIYGGGGNGKSVLSSSI